MAILDQLPREPVVAHFGTTETLAGTVEPASGSPLPTTAPIAGLTLG
ncbi:hypothetical protein [Nocardia sp. NPDC051570]